MIGGFGGDGIAIYRLGLDLMAVPGDSPIVLVPRYTNPFGMNGWAFEPDGSVIYAQTPTGSGTTIYLQRFDP